MEIKIGDVVTLKSGSQEMTVGKIEHSIATCFWSVDNEIRTQTIHVSALYKQK